MSRKYKFQDQRKLYFVSYSVVYWMDVFVRDEYRQIWLDSVSFCQKNKGLEVYGWCLMTSHAHMLIGTVDIPLQDILRDLKKHTSKELKKVIRDNPRESRKDWMLNMFQQAGKENSNNFNFQFWQQHNQPLEISTADMFDKCLNYIHDNPVVAGFVLKPEDWKYSSAAGFTDNNGLLKLHYK